jgi:Aerotolerance regulator N-terminal/von Willebrand factor type A domain
VSVGFPLGLLALVGIVPLVAAYFLRRKQKPRVVSALFLWKSPDLRAEAGPRLQRFSRETSLLLEILALVLAALYLADVRFGVDAPRRHVAVVVDGGLSMSARAGNDRVADRVRDAVAKLAREQQAATLTLIETGPSPHLIAGPLQELTRALAALEAWKPSQPAHAFEPAWRMAKELSGPGAQVFFFTDGPLGDGTTALLAEPPPSWLTVKSVGASLDNLALVSVQRRDAGGVAQLTLRVANFGAREVTAPVEVQEVAGASTRPTASLSANGRTEKVTVRAGGTVALRLGLTASGPLEVSLPDDALPEDGRVTLLPSPDAELTVSLLVGLDSAVTANLKRFVRAAPAVALGEGGPLTFGPPDSGARVTVGTQGDLKSFVGPFFSQKGHPLFEDVFLDGVVWTAGSTAPPGQPLLVAGSAVLVSEEEGKLHLNLELSRSSLARASAWPVLMGNIVRTARLETPGLPRRHLALGEAVPVVLAAGAKHVLVGPDGTKKPVLGQGAVTLPPLPVPGRWTLERDGKEADALVVLPLDARESDLRTRGPYETPPALTPALAALGLDRPRAWWPIALVLLLMLVDFWVTARSRSA